MSWDDVPIVNPTNKDLIGWDVLQGGKEGRNQDATYTNN